MTAPQTTSGNSGKPALTAWVFLLISLGLVLYTSYRGITLSITHDEVGTLYGYSKNSWANILSFRIASANNHILNSMLIKVSTSVFGNDEWAIRLPNMLAHALFLLFSAKLIRRFIPDVWLAVPAFVLLNVHPYMLDFFSLGRGYGLCLMFEMWALYEVLCFWDSRRHQNATWAAVAGALAVLANFSSLQFYAALLAVMVLVVLLRPNAEGRRAKPIRSALIPLLVTLGLALLCYGPITRLREAGELYFGGNRNLYQDTLRTLALGLTYRQDPVPGWMQDVWHILIAAVVIVLVAGIVSAITRIKRWQHSPEIPVMLLLALPMLASVFLFYLNGTLYLIYRTSLIYFPPLTAGVALFFYRLSGIRRLLWPARAAGMALASLVLVHFMLRANLTQVWEWKYDADSKQMMQDLAADAQKVKPEIGRNVRLYVRWVHHPSADYYRNRLHAAEWLAPIHRVDSLEPLDDYFYFNAPDTGLIAAVPHMIIHHYPVSNSFLFRRTALYNPETGGFLKGVKP